MAKYKLEYIWLDGYKPVPNLRGKTQIKEFDSFPKLEELPMWGFDGSSTQQAEGRSSDCMLKPVAVYPDTTRKQRRARHVRSHDARRQHPAPVQRPRHHPRRSGRLVRLRAGILPLPGRPSARLPRRRLPRLPRARTTPASATRTSATSPARSSRSTSTSASTPASTTKASTPKWPRASGNSRSSAKAPRTPPTKCGSPATSCIRLCEKYGVDVNTTASRSATPTGTAPACTPTSPPTYMREIGGKDYFEALMAAFDKYKDEHIAVYGPDNHLRLTGLHETAVDRQVQLRRRQPRRLHPRPAQLREQRLQGLPRRPPSELPGRSLQDRLADPQDHRRSAHRRQVGRRLSEAIRPPGSPWFTVDPSGRNRSGGSLHFDDDR